MGGVSKLPLRRLVLTLGADLVWTEQINAALLLKSSHLLNKKTHLFYNGDVLLLDIHAE